MDIVLGVSMTPTSVRMVLVEGEKADGLTVDHDAFNVGSEDTSATASEQVVTAILGTRESAAEGGHHLAATGVTWRDHDEAAALREALARHHIDDVMLVSELHAAGALAQAVGRAVGYERTALMFLERDTATMSVVQTADGSIVKVQSQDLHTEDAVAELTAMVGGLEDLDEPPQAVFVVGSGVSVAAIKLQLESATSLPVSAPDEAELALARGAALASANAPRFEATTVGLGFADAPVAADVTQLAGAGYMQPAAAASLAYSEVDAADSGFLDLSEAVAPVEDPAAAVPGRKPFLLVGSAMTSIFVIGVAALVISLAVSIRPTVDERPTPGESMVVPPKPPAVALAPEPPAPAPPEPIETIQAPRPVVQEAPAPQTPRTVFVDRAPAPAAPAPAPAAPPPPPPAAPPPPPPVAPPPPAVVPAPVLPPPIVVLPRPNVLPPLFRPPWEPSRDYYNPPKYNPPKYNPPKYDPPKWEPPKWEPPKSEPPQWDPPASYDPPKQQWPVQTQQPQRPRWPGSGSSSGSDRGSSSGSDRGSSRGSSGSDSIWPWPSFGD